MLEILLCSIVTILPDFLIRRFVQGKRIGHEITLLSVWYELRWGIVACLMLAVLLITIIYFYHPTTSAVTTRPAETGRAALVASFGQLEAQEVKVGMAAETTCISKPLAIIPMTITEVKNFTAAGQVRVGAHAQHVTKAGTILVHLEPLYNGGMEGVIPGSSCIANLYTNNYDRLTNERMGLGSSLYLRLVDTVAVVPAMALRMKALLLPVKTLVLGGH